MNIYLIGYRCTGKTTIGKLLAKKTELLFFDTDQEILNHYGMTIAEMIRQHGWPYFRIVEKEVLAEISLKDGYVVATGGGIVLDHNNIVLMKKSGILFWLKAEVETIKKWILKDYKTFDTRPSLTGKDVIADIDETFCYRGNIYKAVSDFSISTDYFNLGLICESMLFSIEEKIYFRKRI